MSIRRRLIVAVAAAVLSGASAAAAQVSSVRVETAVERVMPEVVAWRRDLHQHPELGFAETRTAGVVADHLRALGLEVRTGVGKTGVVGVLRGARPGRTVALRADMDALPVKEATGLAFASTATGTYMGETVPVAHACGHDAHVAMLMGAAQVLAGMKDQISGAVVFIFQPAEEGRGGAQAMLADGLFERFPCDEIYALHNSPVLPVDLLPCRRLKFSFTPPGWSRRQWSSWRRK